MPKFCPDNFKPTEKNILWAMEKFNISRDEVENQVEYLLDHQFRRDYTEWQRVFRNWMRKANEINTLTREHVYRQPDELSSKDKLISDEKGKENLDRLLRMVK